MKRFLPLLLAALCTASFSTPVGADSTENVQYYIPKATAAPTIDGVVTEDEWNNALKLRLGEENTERLMGLVEVCPEADCYWLWDEAGIYFYGDVRDTTVSDIVHEPGKGSYNSGDGLQFCIYPDTTVIGEAPGNMYFFSLVVNTQGEASVGDHFTYGKVHTGADVPSVVAACTQNGASYTIEAFFPASVFAKSTTPIPMEANTTFAMTHVIMETNGTSQALLIDSAWFYAPEANKYTLIDRAAGAGTVETEAPETEPATEISDTTAAETEPQVNETEPSAAEGETAAPASPESSAPISPGLMVAAVAGVVAVAGVLFANRKKK